MRRCSDWLDSYIKFTENTEPPTSYHTWVGISIIASVLQRKVFMKWGHNKIYPSQYIILVGPSGTARKGDAIGRGREFLDHIGVTIASQSITREALIRVMSDNVTSFLDNNKVYVLQAPIVILAAELSVFMGQNNIKLLADLTDLYDAQDSWRYQTKHGEKTTDAISGVCVNLLGATAPDWLPTILPQEAVGGGWTSRVIFIVEGGKGKIVADPNLKPPDNNLRSKLYEDLEKIHLVTGEFKFNKEALEAYVDWYNDQELKMKKGIFPIPDIKFGGYIARRATHVKKIGMCLSIARGDGLFIEKKDFERAKFLMEKAETKMAEAFKGMGKSNIAQSMNQVLEVIKIHGKIKRSELLRRLYGDIDIFILENIEKVLEKMKVIKIVVMNEENEVLYIYTDPGQPV